MGHERRFHQLTEGKRDELFKLRSEGISMRACARQMCVDVGTVSRELKRNTAHVLGGSVYLPDRAQRLYTNRRTKCHPHIKLNDPEFRKKIVILIQKGWSPEKIHGRLKREGASKLLSHELLYEFIYHSEIGKRDRLFEYLPRGQRKRRKQKGRKTQCSRLEGRVWIEERSHAALQRTEVGHWETDSVLCKYRYSVNVLADRMSRKVVITKLVAKDARATTSALVHRLKSEHVRSITADNGPENAQHKTISKILWSPFFFCHPYHSWEKGTVENRNGVIRRYLPRTTDLAEWSQADLDEIAEDINTTPMKCLEYQTPNEVYYSQCCI